MQEPLVVPCPGSFDLHSRVVRLHTGGSYRDITIHEMTESEIRFLKSQRWALFSLGVALGAVTPIFYFITAIDAICAK